MRFALCICAAVGFLMSTSTTTFAQSDSSLAVGGQVTIRDPAMGRAHGSSDIGLLWRLGHGDTGWGWDWSLNWFSTDIDRPVGPEITELGELSVKPFMAGYGYRYAIGGVSVELNAMAGYAFTSFHLNAQAVDAYRDLLGARSVSVDAANTFVTRPEVGIWFDLTRKIGVNVNAGYMIARPRVTIRSTLADESERIRADMFSVKIGMVYRIF
jgi:hypothetical protein